MKTYQLSAGKLIIRSYANLHLMHQAIYDSLGALSCYNGRLLPGEYTAHRNAWIARESLVGAL